MAKINYPFIFEFDSRHNLDWHQLAEVIIISLQYRFMLTPDTAAMFLAVPTRTLHVAQFPAVRG